jgi:hypothetical protein
MGLGDFNYRLCKECAQEALPITIMWESIGGLPIYSSNICFNKKNLNRTTMCEIEPDWFGLDSGMDFTAGGNSCPP